MRKWLATLGILLALGLIWTASDRALPERPSAPQTEAREPVGSRSDVIVADAVATESEPATERRSIGTRELVGAIVLPDSAPPDPELVVVAKFRLARGLGESAEVAPSPEGVSRFDLPESTRGCVLGVRSERYWLAANPVLEASGGYDFGAPSSYPPVELRLEACGRIEGRVLRGLGVDVPSALIRVGLSFQESPRLITYEDGKRTLEVVEDRFSFAGLRSDERVSLSIAAIGCFGEHRSDLVAGPGETIVVELELVAAACVEGRVVTAEGEPLASASVCAFSPDPVVYQRTSEAGYCNLDGQFRIERVKPGRVAVEAKVALGERAVTGVMRPLLLDEIDAGRGAHSWLTWTEDLGVLLAGSTTHVELLAPAIREVLVRAIWPDGRAASGASFQGRLPHVGSFPLHAGYEWGTLAESGEFRLAVAEAGASEILVTAEGPDGEPCFAQWIKTPADPVPAEPLELVLEPGLAASVRVLDDLGTRWTTGLLLSSPIGSGDLVLDSVQHTLDGSDLRVRFPPGGGVSLRAMHGEDSSYWIERDWRHGATEPVVLVLPRLCRVSGEVAGASDHFLSKVRVRSRWPTALGTEAQAERPTRIDEEGRFTFEDLSPGKTWLWIEGRRHEAIELELAPGDSREGIVLYP